MSWIRRPKQNDEPEQRRLPDLEFLALVRGSLEASAPGVTKGAELKGNSLISPNGWAVGVTPPSHGGEHHYDLVALPDVRIQPDVPCFTDCVVAMTGDPRHAADVWAQTAGACLLELLDHKGRFADHAGPDDERGVPGWHTIASGAVGFGLDRAESRRLQAALLDVNVLHRIADTFTADLAAPLFNGVKVFYGGQPGAMDAEIQVNGVRHEAASAAMAALNLPEPTSFTAVRYYALLLPVPTGGEPNYPAVSLGLAEEDGHSCAAGGSCDCGGHLDPERPGFALPLPHLVAELSNEERVRRVRVDTGAIMVADGIGNFLKVRLPVQLDDGRTVVYLVWAYLEAPVIEEVSQRVNDGSSAGHRITGLFCNAVGPWGEALLRAPIVLVGQPSDRPDKIGYYEVVESGHALLTEVLHKRWPATFVLGDRDRRRS